MVAETAGLAWCSGTLGGSTQLHDGTRGHYCARLDDCWRAAAATVLQIPPRQIPDPRLHARLRAGEDPETVNQDAWAGFARFLQGRGWTMHVHANRLPTYSKRWIGVVLAPDRPLHDHCMVMCGREVLFDPTEIPINGRHPDGEPLEPFARFGLADVAWGATFNKGGKR